MKVELDPTLTPTAIVDAESRKRIDVYLETRERWNTVASLSDLTQKVAHEYENRFLIELIQNGYDAHDVVRPADGFGFCSTRPLSDTVRSTSPTRAGSSSFRISMPFRTSRRATSPPVRESATRVSASEASSRSATGPRSTQARPIDPTDPGFSGYCFGSQRTTTCGGSRRRSEFDAVDRDFSRHLLPVPRIPNDPVLTDFVSAER